MRELAEVYEKLEQAERCSREKNYLDALKLYKEVREHLKDNTINADLDGEVKKALVLLREDIEDRIRELERADIYACNTTATFGVENANITGTDDVVALPVVGAIATIPNTNLETAILAKGTSGHEETPEIDLPTPGLGNVPGINKSGITGVFDPLNKLHTTMLSINPSKELQIFITQQFNQYQKEASILEQIRFKEFETKIEDLIKENKKLSNQVVRLRDRWDSLVESAKQKRKQQGGQ